jgi:hypothetical protein
LIVFAIGRFFDEAVEKIIAEDNGETLRKHVVELE